MISVRFERSVVTVRISAMGTAASTRFISCGSRAIIPDYPRGKLDIKLVIEADDLGDASGADGSQTAAEL